jgi:hypothetical protein
MALPPLVGEYVKFFVAPQAGNRNVKISNLNQDSIETNVSHVALSAVIDAGSMVKFPTPYAWEPAINGFQYNQTNQTKFVLGHYTEE